MNKLLVLQALLEQSQELIQVYGLIGGSRSFYDDMIKDMLSEIADEIE